MHPEHREGCVFGEAQALADQVLSAALLRPDILRIGRCEKEWSERLTAMQIEHDVLISRIGRCEKEWSERLTAMRIERDESRAALLAATALAERAREKEIGFGGKPDRSDDGVDTKTFIEYAKAYRDEGEISKGDAAELVRVWREKWPDVAALFDTHAQPTVKKP
jgi:hypothetical protein